MKKVTAMMVVGAMLYNASFAFGMEDINLDLNNENNIRNDNNANAASDQEQNQDQAQQQQQQQKANAVIRGNLPTVGFNGFITPGKADKGETMLFCSSVYMNWSVEDIEAARDKFGFTDFITFNWGSNAEFTPLGKSLPANTNPVSCIDYWPKSEPRSGDRILGSVTVTGKVNVPDEAFVAQAYGVCKEETGSSRVALLIEEKSEDVTSGASFNLSGAISKITGGGDSGHAVASGIGFGKARVRKDGYIVVHALCMNDGGQMAYVPPQPKPEQPCDTDRIRQRIRELEREVQKCTRYCYNNLALRSALGEANIDMFVCTGEKRYLKTAIYHFGVAERNFRNGHDISAHRAEASQVIAQVYYNWAGSIREVQGKAAAMKFAKAKKLERIPSGFTR